MTDIKDNEPAFAQSVYSTEIIENYSLGVTLLQIHDTDSEQGQNSLIYSLIDNEVS